MGKRMGFKLLVGFLLSALLLAAGCSSGTSGGGAGKALPTVGSDGQVDTSVYKKAGPYKIGFSNISVVNSWRVQMVLELQSEAKRRSGEVKELLITDADGKVDKQIKDIEDLLAKGVDALLVTPASPEALVPVLSKAYKSGIPVIVFNSGLSGDQFTAFVGTDEIEFGYKGGSWLMEQLKCKGNIVALDGIAGNSVSEDRFKGLEKAMKECPDGGTNVKILGRYPADWAYDKGKIAMEKALAAFPQIDGVWSQGGAMTQGAIEAFIAAGRPLVPMTGEDNNGYLKAWKKNIPNGFKGMAASEPTWVSTVALDFALKALGGEKIPHSYMVPVPTIFQEDIDKFLRPEYSDSYWTNSKLSKDLADEKYKQ